MAPADVWGGDWQAGGNSRNARRARARTRNGGMRQGQQAEWGSGRGVGTGSWEHGRDGGWGGRHNSGNSAGWSTGTGGGGAKANGKGGKGGGAGGKADAKGGTSGGALGKGPGAGGGKGAPRGWKGGGQSWYGSSEGSSKGSSQGSSQDGRLKSNRWQGMLSPGTKVKCQNTQCGKKGELAAEAGWECGACGQDYDWPKFWAGLHITAEDDAGGAADSNSLGSGYRGRYASLTPDDSSDSDEDADITAFEKGAKRQTEAETASKADAASSEARKTWDAAKANEAKERKQLGINDARLQNLMRQVQEQQDKILAQKKKLQEAADESAAAFANLATKDAEQVASASAHIRSVDANMEAAKNLSAEDQGKQDAAKKKSDEEARKQADKDAKVIRAKKEEKAAEKRAEAVAAAAVAANLAAEADQHEADAQGAAPAAGGEETTGGTAASGGAAAACPVSTTGISHADVAAWTLAIRNWVWYAGEEESVPLPLLAWTNVWGGEKGEGIARNFDQAAKKARDQLAEKRSEFMQADEQVQALAAQGHSEAAEEQAYRNLAYGEETKTLWCAWLDEAIANGIKALLAEREADIGSGLAKEQPTCDYDMLVAPVAKQRKAGKGGASAKGAGRLGGTQTKQAVADAKGGVEKNHLKPKPVAGGGKAADDSED